MSFTYIGNLSTDLDKIRFKIQDTVNGGGPKPSNGNFSDEEIDGLLAVEGTVNRTVAALYETLAIAWANHVDTRIGPRDEKFSQVAQRYAKLAEQWRDDYGYGDTSAILSTGFATRVDGYSDDVDAGET